MPFEGFTESDIKRITIGKTQKPDGTLSKICVLALISFSCFSKRSEKCHTTMSCKSETK